MGGYGFKLLLCYPGIFGALCGRAGAPRTPTGYTDRTARDPYHALIIHVHDNNNLLIGFWLLYRA